jgi:hypothetical protein
MATGTEHYREAETYAEIATERPDGSPVQMSALAFGQLHATLATRPSDANLTFTLAGKPVSPERIQEFVTLLTSTAWSVVHAAKDCHWLVDQGERFVKATVELEQVLKGVHT